MIEQLFGSKTRVKLLRLFFSNPNRSFYVREITRKIDEQINSVRRELSNLLSIGIISSDTNNNRLYYEVNQKYEFYKPLLSIFGVEPSQPAVVDRPDDSAVGNSQLKEILALGNVEAALFTGSFTRDDKSGVDFLLVGDINQAKLNRFIEELERQESKEVRYVVMPLEEYRYRSQLNDRFLGLVLSSKHQVLVDKHDLLAPKASQDKLKDKKKGK